jgi:hypothetical protein
MADKKKNRRWLLLILALMVLTSMACCCGCAGFWHFLPDMLVAAFTEEGPLKAPVVDPDPDVAVRLERAFSAGGEVVVTGEELVQLVAPWEEEELYAFWVQVHEDDTVELALSVHLADIDRFLNVQGRGGVEIAHGWFAHFTMDQLVVAGWDVGQYTRGQQLAEQANRSMADQRAQEPGLAEAMDQIERLWLEDGALHIQLEPGGYEVWKGMRTP